MKVKGIAETTSGQELSVEITGVLPEAKLVSAYRYLKKELDFMCKVTEDTMISMSIEICPEEGELI